MHILAIDIGSTSVKAAAVDVATGNTVGPVVRIATALDRPAPHIAAIDPGGLWNALGQAAREAANDHRMEGIGFSCLTPALLLLDQRDEPLIPIITHLDRQARPEAREVWDQAGAEFLATTGNRPLPGGITATSFLHLIRRDPSLRPRIRRYLHLNGWLGLRLAGRAAFDGGNASFTGLFDTMGRRDWSPRWCDYFGVDQAWLPEVLSGDATLGPLCAETAKEWNLPAGIPVKLGAGDTSCAMLMTGMNDDDLLHVVGTTQIMAVYAPPNPRPSANRLTRLLGVGDRYVQVTHNPVGGVALDWLHGLCFRDVTKMDYYHRLIPETIDRSASVVLDPPFLGGDRLEIEARTAGFRDLRLATDRLDLLAAVLRAMREQHEIAVRALGDRAFKRIFLSGGGAEVVRRLIPAYANAQVIPIEEASLRGVTKLFDS